MEVRKRGFRATLWRELQRISSRPLYLMIGIVLPLISFVLFTSLFGNGTLRNLPVAVVDMDQTAMSRQIIRHVNATPSVKLSSTSSLADAKKRLEAGEVFGVFILPRNFQSEMYAGKSPDAVLYYSNLNLSVGSTVNTTIQSVVMTIAAGANIQKRMLKGQMKEQAYSQAQPIKTNVHTLSNPTSNYNIFLVSALLPVMLQMFILVTVIYAIGLELKEYTADVWMATADHDMVKAISGKLLPYVLIFSVQALFVNSYLFDYLHVPMLGSRLTTDLSLLLMVMAYHAMGVLLIFLSANLRLSVSVGAGYGAMAFSFSGLAFPVEAMPKFFGYLANMFPFRHYLEIFVDQAYRAVPLQISFYKICILMVFLLLPFFLLKRAKQVVSNKKYWGKL